MKTFGKFLLGCGLFSIVAVVVIGIALWMFTGFLGKLFSDVSFTTGPPSKAPSIPTGYQVEGEVVYHTTNLNFFGNWSPTRTKLQGVDVKTFQLIDTDTLAKDAKHVFYNGVAIPGGDPTTFRVFDTRYSADAGQTYFDGKVIPGAKGQQAGASVEILDNRIARDQNHVYALGFILEGADPASIEKLGTGRVWRDKNDYYNFDYVDNVERMIPMHVDMPSFKLLISPHARTEPGTEPWETIDKQIWAHDSKRYYVDQVGHPIADPATFVPLAFGYAKDSKQAYYLDKILANVDVASFRVVDPDHPANWVTSFAPYAKDANQVFYKDRVIKGADSASFVRADSRLYKDKNHCYNQGGRTDEVPDPNDAPK